MQDHRAILHHVANGFAEGDDRNDLMQELLLAVWKAIPAFRDGAQPSTFVYRVSHNAALTWKRTQRNYRNRLERFQSEPASSRRRRPTRTIRNCSTGSMRRFASCRPSIVRSRC